MRYALIAAVALLILAAAASFVGVSMAKDYHVRQLYHVSIQLERDYYNAAFDEYVLPGMYQRRNQWAGAMDMHIRLDNPEFADCWDAFPMVGTDPIPGSWETFETSLQLSDCNYDLAVEVFYNGDHGAVEDEYNGDWNAWAEFREEYEEQVRTEYEGTVYQG